MLVVEFYVLVERSNSCVVEVPVDAPVPHVSTHRNSAVVERLAGRARIKGLISIRRLHWFVIDKILIVLGDELVNWRRRPPAVVLAAWLLPVGVGWYVRIVLPRIPHLCRLDCYR